MAVNWTKEQKAVIESRNRNLLVSAAAGSGKTAVLVERIIRMITDEDPTDIDRLLVMTFTKAAAAEMRERIQAAIEKKLGEDPQNEHLQQQAVTVQFAQITTIDSFCLHILREHFDRLDIDPAFRVGDEGEMLLMRADVMQELMEDSYADGGEAFERFVDTYSTGKADGGIEDYILQVYTFAQSNPWPDEWFEHCRKELENTGFGELNGTDWMQFLLRDVKMQAEEWERQLVEASELCGEEDGPEPYLPMICEDLLHVRELIQSTGSFLNFSEAAEKFTFSRMAAIRGKNVTVDPDKKEAVAECRKRIKKSVEKLKDQYLFESPEKILEDMEAGKESILMLLKLAEEFGERFRARKREKNIVDFGDLEHFALEVLTAGGGEENGGSRSRIPGPVADELSRQFDEILVDEYQDSNLVQETLIHCVSRERFGTPNVFMVGDVKQSIYKFRLACPELFLEKYHTYSTEESLHQKIELHQNFRSRDTVLESINDIFFRIMTEKLGNIEYTEETALHAGASFEPLDGRGPGELDTELLLINTAGSELENLDEDISDYTARELEAGMVAGKIRELTDEENGMMIWDKDENGYRRAKYGDIVILLRSVSGWAESFTEILAAQGIPAFAESRTGYFDTVEVETVLNLLSVIDNPIQDIPLAAVLKAPFCGITDAELAHIVADYKKNAEKGRDRGLYPAVINFLTVREAEPDPPVQAAGSETFDDERICGLLRKILELLLELRKMAVYLPMHSLLYRIFDMTGYYDYVSAMPAGETRRANLDMLVEKASAYEATSYRGVFHFIKYIEKLKKYNTDFGEAATVNEQGNTVRLMSIHKSKGLEFPIVFVAGMGKMFNRQDTRGKILIDSEFGIGTDYLDSEKRLKGPTLKKNVMKRRMELEALGEELRVLYVALTRAKEKLIMTASDKNLENRLEKWRQISLHHGQVPCTILTMAGSCLDWILMSVSRDGCRIRVSEIKAEEQLVHEIEEQLYRKGSKEELLNQDPDRVYDRAYRRRLEASFQFKYPCQADVTLNTKMSVSELKKEGMKEEDEEMAFLPTLPVFMEEQEVREGGTSRGTAYHRAMELLPFDKVKSESDVRNLLDGFTETGKLTKEARDMIWPPDIYRFFTTELGKRMAAAAKKGKLYREKQFVMGIPAREMGGWDSDELVLIQGIIDAWFEEEDGLILVDYKTDYVEHTGVLVSRYKTQLDYYEKALTKMLGKTVKERYIYSYRLGLVSV